MMDRDLLKRLRKRLGLSGLSVLTMASGPCGGCPPDIEPFDECADLERLLRWRERALSWELDESGYLSCTNASEQYGAAGALGLGGLGQPIDGEGEPVCADPLSVYSDEGTTIYREDLRYIQEAARDWDPELGCPSARQYKELQILDQGRAYPSEAGQLSSIEGPSDMCCYHAEGGPAHCPGGRPFLVGGSARVACHEPNRASEPTLDEEIGHVWLRDALSEHASVAAFARLSLQLLHLGAPLSLVNESQQASLDEARHAELCLRRAALHLGRPQSLGSLDVRDALGELELRDLLVTNIIEGCIGETLAATRARARARVASDDALALSLRRLALDEERHAALAWKILDWALDVGPPELWDLAQETFVSHSPRPPRVGSRNEGSMDVVHSAGCLSYLESAACDRETWENIVLPLAFEMFAKRRLAA